MTRCGTRWSVNNWEKLPRETYAPFFEADGLLNEFKMVWALKERFALSINLRLVILRSTFT